MGGVDKHDEHCSNLMPFIRSKKWTWAMLMRLIQSSLTNATVLYNIVREDEKKVGSKAVALEVAEKYLAKKEKSYSEPHSLIRIQERRNCKNFKSCTRRTHTICNVCNLPFCTSCFQDAHK